MTASPSSLLDFPDDNRLARAYFIEANRHLEDAFLLHTSGRYAGSLTSTLKAIELCLKSILILEGARSWVDLNQHEIFTKIISDRPLFGKLQHAINTYDSALPGEIKAIEKLVPQKQEISKLELDVATNTECPFFARTAAPPPDYDYFFPAVIFLNPQASKIFNRLLHLLTALQAISPRIASWSITLCSDLPS